MYVIKADEGGCCGFVGRDGWRGLSLSCSSLLVREMLVCPLCTGWNQRRAAIVESVATDGTSKLTEAMEVFTISLFEFWTSSSVGSEYSEHGSTFALV